jgi:cysteine desulfurase
MFKKSRVYLDWAAATPLSNQAKEAMVSVLTSAYGNPSAVHTEGQIARELVEEARTQIARVAQVKPEHITFTSGGTEANNIAIMGYVEQLHAAGRAYKDMQIITTRIEHPSVTNAFLALASRGVDVAFVEVDDLGQVQKNHLRSLLSEKTVLVSVALINSEIGTIQPLHHLAKILTAAESTHHTTIAFHLDAAQAPLWYTCQFDTLGADLVSLDFAKCCGPKGVGALLRSRRVTLAPVLYGGGQESGLRSGTENVAGIVGGAAAFLEAQREYKSRAERVSKVRDAGIALLTAVSDAIVLNGPEGRERVVNNINLSLLGLDTEYLTVWLDTQGFAVSTKSACAGAGGGESAVVKAISNDTARALSTLRITLGPDTTVQNLQALAEEIGKHRETMSRLTQK